MTDSRWYPVECEHGYDACPICDTTKTFPSGAKASRRKTKGGTVSHLELPYHDGDIYTLLTQRPK